MGDDIMTELLRWEVAEGNHITERTSRLREMHAIDLCNTYTWEGGRNNLDVNAITCLLVAGIYYFILHKDRSTIAGIDINTPAGKRRLIEAIRSIASLMFHSEENILLAEKSEEAEEYRRKFETSCRERIEADYREHVEDLMLARRIADRERIAALLRQENIPEDVILRCVNHDS